jgi:DNA-binding beta-propeller fold protein YncE
MKKILLLVIVALAAHALAQGSKPLYEQTAKWTIGGEGGWDYLTLSPGGDRLFVAHSNVIEVIDTANGNKVGEIPANGAHGIALVADQNRGFSTNGRAGTVTVFKLDTLKPESEIKAGENPDAIIYDPHSKRVIVMNGRSKDLMAIDPSSLKVVATVPLGGKLEFAAADAGHVFVNVEDLGEVAVVNSKTWKEEQRWKLNGCEEPSGLALDHEHGVLFSVCGNKQMVILDTRNGKQLTSLPTGAGTDAAAYDPGLQRAFASNGEGTLTVAQEASRTTFNLAGNVATARGARTMALDPKTHKIYLATAELGPPAEGQRRPSVKAGTFSVLVYSPVR